jgi:hypothetical protein
MKITVLSCQHKSIGPIGLLKQLGRKSRLRTRREDEPSYLAYAGPRNLPISNICLLTDNRKESGDLLLILSSSVLVHRRISNPPGRMAPVGPTLMEEEVMLSPHYVRSTIVLCMP